MKCGWRSKQCITPKKAIQPILGNRKEQIQASGLGQTKKSLGETSSRKVTCLHPKTSAPPQPAFPAAAGGSPGCSWRSACPDDSHRGALRALQELGGAGPPPGVSGWHRWCGAPGQDPPASTMWKGKKGGNGLEFGLMKKMSSTIIPCKCTHNSKLEESNAKFDELTFQHNLDVRHRRSNLPFANKLQPQGASVLRFFAKTLWQPQTSQTETCNAASVLCKHLLLNFNMSMFWHVHTWRDLRWFEMICVKLTCSCIIALLHRWQILRWSENVVVFLHFSQLFPTQNAAPSTRHGDFSTAHQRRLAKLPQALQHPRQVVHRGERHAVLGAQLPLVALQASAPQRLRLREGAARLQHPGEPRPWIATGAEKFHGSKSLDPNIFWAVAIGYTYWCCLMLFDAIWCLL